MRIYKIFRTAEWQQMQAQGETTGAPVDVADGFVHFSTAATVAETARRHFPGEDGLWLITAETDAMDEALRWEVSRGGEKFPHLYRAFRMDDVIDARPLPFANGQHILPALT